MDGLMNKWMARLISNTYRSTYNYFDVHRWYTLVITCVGHFTYENITISNYNISTIVLYFNCSQLFISSNTKKNVNFVISFINTF